MAQGIALVSFPAASHIFLSSTGFGFSATQYGFLFAPQVLTAIAASLLGGALSRRLGVNKIYRVGLLADLVAMSLLAGSQLVVADRGAAYLVLLIATAFLGAGFGLTVPALNALVAGLRPGNADRAVLLLNALRVWAQRWPRYSRQSSWVSDYGGGCRYWSPSCCWPCCSSVAVCPRTQLGPLPESGPQHPSRRGTQ